MSERAHRIPGLVLREHVFALPLEPARPSAGEIEVFAREVVASEKEHADLPWLVFLQGGPGFASPRPLGRSGWIARAVKEFRVLLLDQRGTGRSTPVDARSLSRLGDAREQARYLACFRADSIVADAEEIRRRLLGPGERWTVLGQSFGGFCAAHYLSAGPEGLAGVLFTGGLPPLEASADEVYRRTYAIVAERNRRFYERYPDDGERARRVIDRLAGGEVRLPTGDRLTPRRFQMLGLMLGASDGAESLHYLLEDAFAPGSEDALSYSFLRAVENATHFDTNPIYSILHEACYAQGAATNWAAERVRSEFPRFDPLAEGPPWFTGEMVYPWMFDEYAALRPLKEAAELLARKSDWPPLYDRAVLLENRVPCAAAVYFDDMYVVREWSEECARAIGGCKAWITNEYEHNALRADGERVLDRLLERLRE